MESRPYMTNVFDNIPIYISKSSEIGLLGSFVKYTSQKFSNWNFSPYNKLKLKYNPLGSDEITVLLIKNSNMYLHDIKVVNYILLNFLLKLIIIKII